MENIDASSKKNRLKKAFSLPPQGPAVEKLSDIENSDRAPNVLGINIKKRAKSYATTLSFRVDTSLAERLEAVAHESGWTKTELIVEFLKKALPELEKQFDIA